MPNRNKKNRIRSRVALTVLQAALLSAMLAVLEGCTSIERIAIPKNVLISSDFIQSGTKDFVSHESWSQFLSLYTQKDRQGLVRVDYSSVLPADQAKLKAYIARLENVDTKPLSSNAQLAYWANLYNATTVDVILDHYPVDSIRQIKDGVFDLGPWEDKRLTINARPTSLHDIEHGIVRAVWSSTPEIHYILNCASAGCPNLPQTAFTGDSIENAMREAATVHINDPNRGVRVGPSGHLSISKIYAWYRGDFGNSDANVLRHLSKYAKPDLRAQLKNATSIDGYFYDWSLNDTTLPGPC